MTEPDRVPIVHGTLAGAMSRHGGALEDLYRRYPQDMITVGRATFGQSGPEAGVPSRDPWGCLWVRPGDRHKGQVTYHPSGTGNRAEARRKRQQFFLTVTDFWGHPHRACPGGIWFDDYTRHFPSLFPT